MEIGVAALSEFVLPGAELGRLVVDPIFWGVEAARRRHPVGGELLIFHGSQQFATHRFVIHDL